MLILTDTSTVGASWSHTISKDTCLNHSSSAWRIGDNLGYYSCIHRQVLNNMWIFSLKGTAKRRGNRGSAWWERIGLDKCKVEEMAKWWTWNLLKMKTEYLRPFVFVPFLFFLTLFPSTTCSHTSICTEYLIPLMHMNWCDTFCSSLLYPSAPF